MIIYGSRMYGKKNVVIGYGRCEGCGTYGKHQSYDARKWGHLYFIPLIPDGPPVRIMKECKHCKCGMHVPQSNTPSMLRAVQKMSSAALNAMLEGRKEYQDDGETFSCLSTLAKNMDMLYCLEAKSVADHILKTLEAQQLHYEYAMVQGVAFEFHGDLNAALQNYHKAAELQPDDAMPLIYMGEVCMFQNNYSKAALLYENALTKAAEPRGILHVLLGVYEKTKNHDKLVHTYEHMFKIEPKLTQEKKVVKAYNKACKKCGKPTIKVK